MFSMSNFHVLRTYSTCSYPGYQDTTTYAALRSIILAFLSVYSTSFLIASFFLVLTRLSKVTRLKPLYRPFRRSRPSSHFPRPFRFPPPNTYFCNNYASVAFFKQSFGDKEVIVYFALTLCKRFAKLYRKKNIDQQNSKPGPKYLKFWKNENSSENQDLSCGVG